MAYDFYVPAAIIQEYFVKKRNYFHSLLQGNSLDSHRRNYTLDIAIKRYAYF